MATSVSSTGMSNAADAKKMFSVDREITDEAHHPSRREAADGGKPLIAAEPFGNGATLDQPHRHRG